MPPEQSIGNGLRSIVAHTFCGDSDMRKVAIAALAGLALMAGPAVAADAGASRNVADRVGSAKGPATSNPTPAVGGSPESSVGPEAPAAGWNSRARPAEAAVPGCVPPTRHRQSPPQT